MDYSTKRELQSIAAKRDDPELVYDPTLPGWRKPTQKELDMVRAQTYRGVHYKQGTTTVHAQGCAQIDRNSSLSSDSAYQSTLTKSDCDCIYIL